MNIRTLIAWGWKHDRAAALILPITLAFVVLVTLLAVGGGA